MPKFQDYPEAVNFDENDIILKDGTEGTKRMYVKNAARNFAGLVTPDQRRNVYYKGNLGTTVTAEQKAAIQNGTFDNMFPGSYWYINNIVWLIADMDYWYNTGDTAFTRHHLVIVPENSLYNEKMNETNTTEGGYALSYIRTEGLNRAKEMARAAFGDMVLTHREYLTNAVTDGYPSGGAWFDSDVELMNEIMVYGTHVYAPANNGTTVPNKYTTGKQQLALFRLSPKAINKRESIWLRDVVSEAFFASVLNYGYANYNYASNSRGVRLVFPIG